MNEPQKCQLDVIGIPVVEHCNLNCKGCLHFCHKEQDPHYYVLAEFENDLKKMHEFFAHIGIIRLYGGEPLLHKDLEKFILGAWYEFPNSTIELLTNGILICTIKDTLIDILRICNVKICWSVYPIMSAEQITQICTFLESHQLYYEKRIINKFYACYDPNGTIVIEEAYKKCNGKYCHILRNGKLSACPAPLVGHYIKKFGVNIDFSDGILDIYRISEIAEIERFLHTPHDFCKYCAPPKYFEWGLQQDSVSIKDWTI